MTNVFFKELPSLPLEGCRSFCIPHPDVPLNLPAPLPTFLLPHLIQLGAVPRVCFAEFHSTALCHSVKLRFIAPKPGCREDFQHRSASRGLYCKPKTAGGKAEFLLCQQKALCVVVGEQFPTSLWLLPLGPWVISPFPCSSSAERIFSTRIFSSPLHPWVLGGCLGTHHSRGSGCFLAGATAQGEVEALQDPSEDGVREQVCEEMGGL